MRCSQLTWLDSSPRCLPRATPFFSPQDHTHEVWLGLLYPNPAGHNFLSGLGGRHRERSIVVVPVSQFLCFLLFFPRQETRVPPSPGGINSLLPGLCRADLYGDRLPEQHVYDLPAHQHQYQHLASPATSPTMPPLLRATRPVSHSLLRLRPFLSTTSTSHKPLSTSATPRKPKATTTTTKTTTAKTASKAKPGPKPAAAARTDPSITIPHPDPTAVSPSEPPVVPGGGAHGLPTLATFSLQGRVGVVTGGARGLGLVMGQGMVVSGADLAIVDLNSEFCHFSGVLFWKGGRGGGGGLKGVERVVVGG